jgi:DNA-binding NarL/FixJ family response regulator
MFGLQRRRASRAAAFLHLMAVFGILGGTTSFPDVIRSMSSEIPHSQVVVLLVEDEIIVLEDLRLRLKAMGYAVRGTATSGEDAVRLARELQPDVVVMDISLRGGMDGVEAATIINMETGIPVVYVTGLGDPDTMGRAQATPGHSFVLKPVDDRELNYVIEMAIRRRAMTPGPDPQ